AEVYLAATSSEHLDCRAKPVAGLRACPPPHAEVHAGRSLLWSGHPQADRRGVGVAFAFQTEIVRCLPCLPQGNKAHLMSLRLPLRADKFVNVVNACAAPRMTNSDETKNKFYEDLHALPASAPKADKLTTLGEFVADSQH
ncbi:unnamed protein product, partial [Dibothriocephalus latus]